MSKKFFSSVVFASIIALEVVLCSIKSFAFGNIYFVNNEKELREVISATNDYDFVILGNDVYLQKDLEISNSITLDLNGNTIYILKEDASIITGKEIVGKKEIYKEKEFKKYSSEDDVQIADTPITIIIDGYGNIIKIDTQGAVEENVLNFSTKDVQFEDVISYNDDLNVTIINGEIIHCDGTKGIDGNEDTWIDFDGKNGTTPSEPIKVLSGTLNLYDMAVYGGNGGNGGDGKYQSLLHIPFAGGAGGNGGNGGDGGNAIKFLREECTVFIDENTVIIPGRAGKGGQKGDVNPNWWLYKGIKGIEGKNGESGQQIS